MFASQLLRILQTLPADVEYETWVFDCPEVKLTMKENQNEFSRPSNGSGKKADSVAFKIADENDSWNASVTEFSEVLDRSTNSTDKKVTDDQKLRDQEGPLCHSNRCERDLESSFDNNELWSSSEVERSITIDSFTDRDEKESGDLRTFSTSVSPVELYSRTHFYADESVRECELPEVRVCYTESNYHIVKDICVDEGLPTQDKTLIKIENDDHSALFVSQPHAEDKHNGTTKGCHDKEPGPVGLEDSTIEDISNNVSSEHGTKEVDAATNFLDGSKSSLEDDAEDAKKVLEPGDSKQMSEANWSTTGRTEDDVSEDKSATSSRHSSQELIVHDSCPQSFNNEKIAAPKQLDEVPSVEAILESLAVAFTTDDPKKNVESNNLQYNSKVESGTITFNFDSSKPSPDSTEDGSAENNHEESLMAENVPEGEHGNLEDNSTPTLPPRTSNAEKNENGHEPKAPLCDAADRSYQIRDACGELSFSSSGPVSGRITYSEPIAYSGSLSIRSDSSTTSTRSFAFPVLQSEWNSSPVRMAKADRRGFRKNRGWRQGLFCCRF